MDDQCGIFADEAEIPLFCIENAEQAVAMLSHCIGRRNVESIVWSAWGSVGAGVDKIRQNSPFFVCFGRRGVKHLRADPRNRRFARNRGLCFTGRSQKSTF